VLEVGFAERLEGVLPRATEIIRSQRIITAALLRAGKKEDDMALADKASLLAERIKSIPDTFGKVMDVQLARLDTIEQRGAEAAKRLTSVVDDVDSAVTSTENVINQITNGGPG